jgi:(p)ppGpp synthase/HD superfamily hydrolase
MLLILSVHVDAVAEEDPYLSAISREAQKVEVEGQPALGETDENSEETEEGLSLKAFETDLKTRHKGSYTFYQKLPRRSREEVFQEYRDGASIDEIRQKIMERFLQR